MPRQTAKPWGSWLRPDHYSLFALYGFGDGPEIPGAWSLYVDRHRHLEPDTLKLVRESMLNENSPVLFYKTRTDDYVETKLAFCFPECWSAGGADTRKIYDQFKAACKRKGLKLVWSLHAGLICTYTYDPSTQGSPPPMPDLSLAENQRWFGDEPPAMLREFGPWNHA